MTERRKKECRTKSRERMDGEEGGRRGEDGGRRGEDGGSGTWTGYIYGQR